MACHTLDGTRSVGPSWMDISQNWGQTRPLKGGRTAVYDEAYIEQSILTPQKDIAEGYSSQMPIKKLEPDDIISITEFIRSLKDRKP